MLPFVMPITKVFAVAALLLSAAGLLLVFEVIRPFRDLSVDGPLALVAWGIGMTLGVTCLFLKARSIALGVIVILANAIPLLAAGSVWWLMRGSNFAWH